MPPLLAAGGSPGRQEEGSRDEKKEKEAGKKSQKLELLLLFPLSSRNVILGLILHVGSRKIPAIPSQPSPGLERGGKCCFSPFSRYSRVTVGVRLRQYT